jgi:hypothetical protein
MEDHLQQKQAEIKRVPQESCISRGERKREKKRRDKTTGKK